MSEHCINNGADEGNEGDGDNVKFEFVEEMRDRSIILDQQFDEFILLTQRLLVEVDEKPENLGNNLILLAETVMCVDNVISDVDFVNFKWAYSIGSSGSVSIMTEERLKELDLTNNLDSVIGYADGFTVPDYMMVGLIGGICHKMGNVSEIIVHSPNGPQEKSTFYLKII
ncbi:MAG: hypothetical protein WD512_12450 [Candidatus Paceibacterota bacterium]